MGIMLDSTDRVMKNQKIAKEISRDFLNIQTPKMTIDTRNRREKKVGDAKRVRETG